MDVVLEEDLISCICYSSILPLVAIQRGWQVVGWQRHLWVLEQYEAPRQWGNAKSIVYWYLFMSHALKFPLNNNQLLLPPSLFPILITICEHQLKANSSSTVLNKPYFEFLGWAPCWMPSNKVPFSWNKQTNPIHPPTKASPTTDATSIERSHPRCTMPVFNFLNACLAWCCWWDHPQKQPHSSGTPSLSYTFAQLATCSVPSFILKKK